MLRKVFSPIKKFALITLMFSNLSCTTEWDKNGTRYQLVQSNKGTYNWLFVPGGAGADSSYFLPMIKALHLPGKTWLIDFPGNGSNIDHVDANFSFDKWFDCLNSSVQRFKNTIYVGHSFGGMLPLLFPQLENILKGLIIVSASTVFDPQENAKMARERNVIIDPEPAQQFKENPTPETFKKALIAGAPLHFPESSLAEGIRLFENLPFNFHAALWWGSKVKAYKAQWVPQHVPTLILGGDKDCINPISLFQKDARFKRDNISIAVLNGSGHFPWLENLETIKKHINAYVASLPKDENHELN